MNPELDPEESESEESQEENQPAILTPIRMKKMIDISFNSSTENEYLLLFELRHPGLDKIRDVEYAFVGSLGEIPDGCVISFSETERYFVTTRDKKSLIFYELNYMVGGDNERAEQVGDALQLVLTRNSEGWGEEENFNYGSIKQHEIEGRMVTFTVEASLIEFPEDKESHIFEVMVSEGVDFNIRLERGYKSTNVLTSRD